MRILSLHIDGFGALSDTSMTFTAGSNTLLRDNGWGKSTLAVFIKAMLYGLPASGKRSLLDNERKRYAPWGGGLFGGSMDVEVGDRRLRLERTFGRTEAADLLTVTDLNTGKQLPPWGKISPGEEWFGVDAAAYERSTYLSQRSISDTDGALSIHAKLNRLVDATDDIGSFDRAMSILEKQRKYFAVSGGRRGVIADGEEQLRELEQRRARCLEEAAEAETAANALTELRQQLQQASTALQDVLARERAHHERVAKQAHLQHTQELLTLAQQEQEAAAQTLSQLGGTLPTEEDILAVERGERQCMSDLLQLERLEAEQDRNAPEQRELAALHAQFAAGAPTEEQLEAWLAQAQRYSDAEQQYRAAREGISPLREEVREEAALPSPLQLERLRTVFSTYDRRCAELMAAQTQLAAELTALEQRRVRKGRIGRLLGAVGVGAALLCLVVGVLMPTHLIAALVTAAVLGVGGMTAALLLGRQAKQTHSETALRQRAEQLSAQRAALQNERQGACALLSLSPTDTPRGAAEALALLSRMEQERERRAAERRQYERQTERLGVLAAQLGEEEAAWRALIGQTMEPPAAAQAVGWVERKRAEVRLYRTLMQKEQQRRDELVRVRTQLQQGRTALNARLAILRDAPQQGVAQWLRERVAAYEGSLRSAARWRAQAEQLCAEQGISLQEQPALLTEAQIATAESTLQQEREQLQQQVRTLERHIALARNTLQQHSEAAAKEDGVLDEIAAVSAQLIRDKRALSCVQATQDYLAQAKERLSGRYLERMKQSFADYFSLVAGEDAATFTMDGNFVICLRRGGASRSAEAFSRGERDVIALCARFALIDALFEGEAPFLVLDDPLVNMDDATAQRAKQLLDRVSQTYQTLYLTCHSSRA